MRVWVRGSLFTHCTVTCSFLVKKEMKDLKYPLKFGRAGSSSNPFSTRRTVRSLKASPTPVPGFRTRSQTESPVWRVTLRTSDSSEALERWSLIKTSLQSELVHTPPPPTSILPSRGHVLQMRVQCKPQKCCPLKGLTFPTAESPSNGWCTNFPWVYRDRDQTLPGTGNEQRARHSPPWHLQAQRSPSASALSSPLTTP